jgi:alkanesulfonate monooxygenase SsuD/methylene tetrahydromethanopterin reductase-like flavin-dependent oxidoreductase (luciferase family)
MSDHQRPAKLGIFLPTAERQMARGDARWRDLLAMTRTAEEIGLDSIWLQDHLLIRLPGHAQQGVWECWSLVCALAASTARVEIGTLVVATSFRNPALLAKMADTADEISGGRIILGIGAGYQEGEYRAFGYPFDHRVSRFEEALQIIHGLLKHGAIDFEGTYYAARECELRPRGPRPQGPPIMIGTQSPRMLGLTARYADIWNGWLAFGRNHPDVVPPMTERVDAACRAAGRDPATLARTLTVMVDLPSQVAAKGVRPERISGTPEEIAAQLKAFADLGMTHIQLWLNPMNQAGLYELAPVLEAFDRA